MIRRARAFFVTVPGRGEIREEELASPGPGELVVETLFSAVSRGTESLVFNGRVPQSEYDRMRCPHQSGEFPGPVKYGYSNVGRVVEGPKSLENQRVFCLYPHQTAYVVPEAAVVTLPADVPSERAVLAANMETAVNALWDAAPLVGDRVSVVGAGVVGALVAYLVRRLPAVDLELVDVRPERARLASALGARFATPQSAETDRDLVFHASGTREGLRTALELAGKEASLIELSWFGDAEIDLSLGGAFHSQRLTLRASQVGSVSPRARPRFSHRRRLELALSLCADPLLDVLVSGESDFESLPELMPILSSPATDCLCHRLRYRRAE